MLVGILLKKLTKNQVSLMILTLNNSVEIEGIIDVDEKLIKDICNYCESQAIYDKLGRYGDFYYKLVRYFWV